MSRLTHIPLLLLALGALAIGGCGGDDDDESAASERPATTAEKARALPVQADSPVVPDLDYTTTLFEPKATIRVPGGAWTTVAPESRDHVGIGLTSDGSFNLAGFGLHRMTKVADPQRGAATVADAVDAPEDYIAWLADHPRLDATEPTEVTVAGVKGTQIDVSPSSFPKRRPVGCKEEPPFQPCLVLFFDGAEPVWYYRSGQIRFTGIDVGGEQIVLEQFVDPDKRFDAITEEKLDPILAALKFSE